MKLLQSFNESGLIDALPEEQRKRLLWQDDLHVAAQCIIGELVGGILLGVS